MELGERVKMLSAYFYLQISMEFLLVHFIKNFFFDAINVKARELMAIRKRVITVVLIHFDL